ncbi:MAG: non-homologous end-joining DNA ligase [Solirubrobacteraceae bacterium]
MSRVELTHPDKVLFADPGVTKAELAAYYETVAPVLLEHVQDRPLSLQVFPGGVGRGGHFLKQIPGYFPAWVARAELPKRGGTVTHVVARDADTLRMLVQHNAITPHVPTARLDRPDRPDRLVIDFDPPGEDRWPDVVDGARRCGHLLREAGLEPFATTTGSRGLHVVAPLRREAAYPAVLAMARDLAGAVVAARPDAFTTAFLKDEREGRVFVDVLRNRPAQTVVAPYGVRALDGAPVATPLAWAELDDAALRPRGWTLRTIPERLGRTGDPWARISAAAASPRSAARRLAAAAAGAG